MDDEEYRNWAEIPPELLSAILHRLGAIEILKNAQRVCRSWRRVCKDLSMWRKIDMRNDGVSLLDYNYDRICRQAVDLSKGGLVDINIYFLGTDSLFSYIAERSSNLKCLRLNYCYQVTGNGVVSAVMKLNLLENLEILHPCVELDLKAIGNSCPLLKTFKLNRIFCSPVLKCDDEALAIAETMSKLRHLELLRNPLTLSGLNAILDNCLQLEHLDLRRSFNINRVRHLEGQCSKRIKYLSHFRY